MARVMGTYGGLVGPKTENVEKPVVLPLLFEEHLKGATTKTLFWGDGGGSPGRDIERGKPLFRRRMGRQIPTQTTQATRAWRIQTKKHAH